MLQFIFTTMTYNIEEDYLSSFESDKVVIRINNDILKHLSEIV